MAKAPGTPAPRDYGQETRDTLQAQVDLAPAQFAAESEFRPQRAQLDLDVLGQTLRGSGGSAGLLDLYEKEIAPALSRVESQDRDSRISGELGALTKYAPGVARTLREASGNAGLLDTLNRQAQEGLDAGAGLDPSMAHEVEQAVRTAQAARGFGFGAPDAIAEAFARGSRGNQLRNERRAFAGNVVQANQMTGGDPFMAILGRPSQTIGMIPGVAGQGQGIAGGPMFSPESAYAQDIFNTNYNASAASKIAGANNSTALMSAGIGAAGSAAGAM
jgi:hypothetical protein